ncbi:helicase DnaB [Cohnella sp. CFH 77786]|uniref:DnaD domain protein n=1 Tax=Cohnella sp. CFH 77786 TaxID=2662265 RepID=UPI001C608560|nr:DnaD domain protein [Cohnella sp. CFH 77786]MBW5447300.1 helicase DnaB [Cohnella sp. CFH 77786]
MHVSNVLEFTENHRFFVYRDFALSALDRKLFVSLYQPIVGALSSALYHLLYQKKTEEEIGYSALEPQRRLFLGLGVEMNAPGRKSLAEAASRLEAVGLMQSYRHYNPLTEESVYEYSLIRPLGTEEFFANLHLTLLLRDKIGKPAVLELRQGGVRELPPELSRFVNREEVTVPFYELFHVGMGQVDPDLEPSWTENAAAFERSPGPALSERIRHADMLLRFPRGSANRRLVESLGRAPESMAQINYLAYKYDLDVPEICRLLDEDGIFEADGALRWEELNRRAHSVYRQDRKREEERERFLARGETRLAAEAGEPPADAGIIAPLEVPERLAGEVAPDQYMSLLRREPYTRVLGRHFPGAVPDSFMRIFERIDLNYKLPEPVINVLIHYVFGMKHAQRLTHAFIDSIASNMLAKGIDTFDRAVAYIREQQKLNETLERRRKSEDGGSAQAPSRGKQPQRRKPAMPVVEDKGPAKPVSPEEREKMRELVRKLKYEQ